MEFPLTNTKKRKLFDSKLCLICQETTEDSLVKNPKQESFTRIKEASIRRQDSIFTILDSVQGDCDYKYHRSCYSVYTSKVNISRKEKQVLCEKTPPTEPSELLKPTPVVTRSVLPPCDYKKCIFCQKITKKKVSTIYRVSEEQRAIKLLKICRERQDDVFTRLSTCYDAKDIFAADIMYHKLCMLSYFNEQASSSHVFVKEQQLTVEDAFSSLVLEIDDNLKIKCLELSSISSRLKNICIEKGIDVSIDNRLTKKLLLQKYGECLFFSKPADQSKSPLVFRASLEPSKLVETIRDVSEENKKHFLPLQNLKEEMKSTRFSMKGFVCTDSLISEELNNFNLPPAWFDFFKLLLGKERNFSDDTKRKCCSIFMDLHYLVNEGNHELTPKHVSLAQLIHHYTRSKLLVTVLNKLGHCISYSSLQKIDNHVLNDVLLKNTNEEAPLPTNIIRDPTLFVHGAIDNDDFNEETLDGKMTTHVTAMVMYQTAPDENHRSAAVERIPSSNIKVDFTEILSCQTVKKCVGVHNKPDYHPSLFKHTENVSIDENNMLKDIIWVLCRMIKEAQGNDCISNDSAQCIGWTSFNKVVSKNDMRLKTVGFCSIFPGPPTTIDNVYSVLKNFISLNNQLDKKYYVLSCDMAIYLIAKLIQIQRRDLDKLYLRIGSFHLAKNWLSVLGMFVRDSGFADILIETGIYGENTLRSILKGVQYNRGVRVHKLMYEACRRLQIDLFFREKGNSQIIGAIDHIKAFQEAVMSTEEHAPALYDVIEEEVPGFVSEFNVFLKECSSNNETFKYWCDYCSMVEILLNCIRAEREGDWELHLRVVEKMIPYFLIFNHINYVRGCILYLADMKTLPEELKTPFKQGYFTVKRSLGKFNSVATDHALEQSLIRSSKVQGGLIGITKNENAMLKWSTLYHYKASVTKDLQEYCYAFEDPTGDSDIQLHKESGSFRVERDEVDVQYIMKFLLDNDNPFESSPAPLRNIVNGIVASGKVTEFLLNVQENGKKLLEKFVEERIIQKVKGIYAPLQRVVVLTLSEVSSDTNKKGGNKYELTSTNVSSTVMLANQRNFSVQDLLQYEMVNYPPSLAHENGMLKKSVKSDLMNAIEKDTDCSKLIKEIYPLENSVFVIDGMCFIHNVPSAVLKSLNTFQDYAEHQIAKLEHVMEASGAQRVDLVYDKYSDMSSSIKNTESDLRACGKSPLTVKITNDTTKLPKQWSRYMASPENKKSLLKYVGNYILNNLVVPNGIVFFISGCFDSENECFKKDGNQVISLEEALTSNHKEADTNMFVHIKQALVNTDYCIKNVILHSPDTDVFVLAISQWPDLKICGCESLWMVWGNAEKKRVLGCHIAAEKLGSEFSKGLPALHVFSGCDSTSKIGTKKAIYNLAKTSGDVINILCLLHEPVLSDNELQKLERLYLKINKKRGQSCDESRYIHFISTPAAITNIGCLPCTSDSFRMHILRCRAQLYYWTNATVPIIEDLDLREYGFYMDNDSKLRPKLMTKPPLPESLIKPCKCKSCSRNSCVCVLNKISCCSYCSCKDKCKNVHAEEEDDVEEERL